MRTLFKVLLRITVLCIVAVISLATVDPNDYKDWIVSKVQDETDLALLLDDDINVTFYP